jgi:asparagine synthase (glutamine-hydrolysing)
MCGIAGIIAKNELGRKWMPFLPAATHALSARGPDAEQLFNGENVAFGHCRLTIIDLSEAANQPMSAGGSVITYNGEIFNFHELKEMLVKAGTSFKTHSDTEVLLQLYRAQRENMFGSLNGFFAFAVYDTESNSCLIARDRFGVKPLYYYEDENCLVFASEIKALLHFPIDKQMDHESLFEYLQLNYIPGPHSIFRNIKKLQPGHYLKCENGKTASVRYYSLPAAVSQQMRITRYDEAKSRLFELLDDAVLLRLISDVPLGAFLSGGLDSSIISGLASRHTRRLKTFSIGFKEHGFFNETEYARAVARHFATDHTEFSLTRQDLHESVDSVLNYLDEPFGDSSALPVYILSKLTRKEVKVALSGDGADELFGGYQKHLAEYRASHPRFLERRVTALLPLWKRLPKSRNSFLSNRFRQLERFASAYGNDPPDRYWKWCAISDMKEASALLKAYDAHSAQSRKDALTQFVRKDFSINGMLMNDVHLVLPDDMLQKVDSMSMATSLEVRTPFLDYRLAEFAFNIPSSFKLDHRYRKKIVQDAFRDFLPRQLYHRPKHGFEIPLHSLLTRELRARIDTLLSDDLIASQNIFHPEAVVHLKRRVFSPNPGDSAARIWGLLVFQHWWKRTYN